MNKGCTLGIDIGGSHITTGLVDLEAGLVVDNFTIRRQVDPHAPAADIVSTWCEVVKEIWEMTHVKSSKIGIAMPGPFDYANGISLIKGFHKYESLYGLNIKNLMAEQLAIDAGDIKLRNDAEAFLEGEVFCGAAKGFKRSMGITMGTGLGSAKNEDGVTETAEMNVLPLHAGIAEDFISTRWFIKRYHELTGTHIKDVQSLVDLMQDDEDVIQLFKEFSGNLALALQTYIGDDSPDVLIIGGGISNAYDYFSDNLMQYLDGNASKTVFRKAALGEMAALIGAACCWKESEAGIFY